mmetsp:Transcript_28103/g.42520  ORF Transcript_28103/g.42520 Transcript_28103/m.42520 type:complete len:385 (+) Transcript_28103:162-1316(+)
MMPYMLLLNIIELKIGRCIGKGGFSAVSLVDSIELDDVYDTSESESNLRKAFCQRHNNSEHELVIKLLRTDLGEEEHVKGVMDLAIEAEFLQTLSHPNIITMQAYANSDPHEARFFVILDRLVMTLERKLPFWRKEQSENAGFYLGPCMGYCCGKSPVLNRLWVERLVVSRDIAKAIQFIHSKDIIYRDLKPDNVGFDAKGDLKIFDFGLAKRMEPEYRVDRELYNLTGNTGSLRYMAPEVAMCEPYDQRVDAYSFGILFWQICSLTTPFQGFSTKMHSEKVVHGRTRPQPSFNWPLAWTQLQHECWSHDIFQRPDFEHIYNVLEEEVTDWTDFGGIPTRASEARAKKHNLREATDALQDMDVDSLATTEEDGPTVLNHNANIV